MFKGILILLVVSILSFTLGCASQPTQKENTVIDTPEKNLSNSSIPARDFHYWFQYYLNQCRPSDDSAAIPSLNQQGLMLKETVDALCETTDQDWANLLVKLQIQFAIKDDSPNNEMLYNWLSHELQLRQQQSMSLNQLKTEMQQCRYSQRRLQQTINELGKIEQQLNERQRESELN